MDRCSQRLREHLTDPQLSVQGLAQHLGVHRSHLSRCFQEDQGQSIMQTITRLRLQKACEVLRNTADSIANISRLCGYEDPNYFSRAFKETLGESPSRYRRGARSSVG